MKVHINDRLILLILVAIEIMLNSIEPFHRFVSDEMMADLKYPLKERHRAFRGSSGMC